MEEELAVRVGADGGIRFRGNSVPLGQLEARLREAVEASPGQALTIYGDGRVNYETVVRVMDAARKARAPGIVLATEEPAAAP